MKTKKSTIPPAALSALLLGEDANFIAAATPGGIERQEKQGQIEQSFKETLPRDFRLNFIDCRNVLEKLGFVFGDNADDLFVNVRFPEGWRKSPTDHSMWTDILDEKGRKRGSIFYKAAFYDRSADGSLCGRFGVSESYKGPKRAFVTDASGEVNHEISGLPDASAIEDQKERRKAWTECDAAKDKLAAWLNENYPLWEDVTAYW